MNYLLINIEHLNISFINIFINTKHGEDSYYRYPYSFDSDMKDEFMLNTTHL
jgi:hypothetical protein